MRLVLVEPPDVEPLTAAQVKARLNIGTEVSDATIDAFIKAARQQLDGNEGFLGRSLNTQTWRGTLDEFPSCDGGKIEIPLPPLQSIESITYVSSGSDVVMDVADYQLVPGSRPYVVPVGSWPSADTQSDAVTIEFISGFGDEPEDVPEPIRQAIVLMVSEMRSLSSQNLFVSEDKVDGIGSKRYVVGEGASIALAGAAQRLLSAYRVMHV